MKEYSNGSKGFGIAIVVMFIIFIMVTFTGCLSFGAGPNEPMLERGQRICEDTNGEWIDNRCVYPAWPMVDTTIAVLGIEA